MRLNKCTTATTISIVSISKGFSHAAILTSKEKNITNLAFVVQFILQDKIDNLL